MIVGQHKDNCGLDCHVYVDWKIYFTLVSDFVVGLFNHHVHFYWVDSVSLNISLTNPLGTLTYTYRELPSSRQSSQSVTSLFRWCCILNGSILSFVWFILLAIISYVDSESRFASSLNQFFRCRNNFRQILFVLEYLSPRITFRFENLRDSS